MRDSSCDRNQCSCHGHSCVLGPKFSEGTAAMRTTIHGSLQYLCSEGDNGKCSNPVDSEGESEKCRIAEVLCKELGFPVYGTTQRPQVYTTNEE